jgi:PIN domain nuclease of toxin-antitoxin system
MKRLLPDTQMLVWLSEDSSALPREALALMRDPANEIFFSLASIWEASIKFALGRPDFTTDPRSLRRGLLKFGFSELAISSEHVIAVCKMPLLHRDPFDRLLVAQADFEGLILMTTDKELAQYGPHVKRFK